MKATKATKKIKELANTIEHGMQSDIWYDPRLYAPAFAGEQEGYENKIDEAQTAMNDAVQVLRGKVRPPPKQLREIADDLDRGVGDDIWYAAHDFGDDDAYELIEEVQSAMQEASGILRKMAGGKR
jgi:hypothetical protein